MPKRAPGASADRLDRLMLGAQVGASDLVTVIERHRCETLYGLAMLGRVLEDSSARHRQALAVMLEVKHATTLVEARRAVNRYLASIA